MTKEERNKAIRVLDEMKVKIDIPKAAVTQLDKNWALDMAIKALDQQDRIAHIAKEDEWIIETYKNDGYVHHVIRCPKCGHRYLDSDDFNYCPNCGKKHRQRERYGHDAERTPRGD